MTIFVFGTGTDVGKTWVLVQLIGELRRRGHQVAASKPAQSFGPDEVGNTDADLLAAATGAQATTVCPSHRWYPIPMAPPMAAAELGLPLFTIADLAHEVEQVRDRSAPLLVEGAGGPRSPVATDGDNVDLARAIGTRFAVLVGDAGLGTINAVRLGADALHGFDTVVVLNRFDPTDALHRANHIWLERVGYQVLTSVEGLADQVGERLP